MKKVLHILKETVIRLGIGVSIMMALIIGCTLVVEWERYKEIFVSFYTTLTYQFTIATVIIAVSSLLVLMYVFLPTILKFRKIKRSREERLARETALQSDNVVDIKSKAKSKVKSV